MKEKAQPLGVRMFKADKAEIQAMQLQMVKDGCRSITGGVPSQAAVIRTALFLLRGETPERRRQAYEGVSRSILIDLDEDAGAALVDRTRQEMAQG